MKTTIISGLGILLSSALFAGCVATPSARPVARISYPVTYEIEVSNTHVVSSQGPQSMKVNAVHQVVADPGDPLYFRVDSPVEVTIFIYDLGPTHSRVAIGELRGTKFTSSITPQSSDVEFAFATVHANTGATVKFTLSDRPIPPSIAQR